jgi:CheY-like chemotaxis protein/HPt (histidine-containing phosphotransfer) domain-containing protein
MGYHADVASNGLEALAMCEHARYDVVLMDVQMPEMDGLEATRSLLDRYDVATRPYIIGLTANATVEDRKHALGVGMNDYLSKPVRPEEIAAALEQAAAWKKQRDGARTSMTGLPPPSTENAMLNDMLETLREITGDDDTDFILDLLESYRHTTPALLADIEHAARQGDALTMGKAAHSLKSSSAMIGCSTFSARCAALEAACRGGAADGSTLATLNRELQQAYPAVEAAIDALTRQLCTPQPPASPSRSGFGLSA